MRSPSDTGTGKNAAERSAEFFLTLKICGLKFFFVRGDETKAGKLLESVLRCFPAFVSFPRAKTKCEYSEN